MAYAQGTSVPIERSQGELLSLVKRFGAKQLAQFEDEARGIYAVMFEASGRRIRFEVVVPPDLPPAEKRRRWRTLVMLVKAKLVAVEDKIITVEEAFFPDIMVPTEGGGWRRIIDEARPQIALAYKEGKMPPMLPGA